MDRWKAEQGRGREKRKIGRKKSRRERVRVTRKKMQMREKVGKSRKTVFFQWFVSSRGSKSRLAKAAGAEPAGQTRDEKLHAVVARSTFASQNVRSTPGSRSTFGSWDVEKAHAVVARSTFPSQNVQNTPGADHIIPLIVSHSCRKRFQIVDGSTMAFSCGLTIQFAVFVGWNPEFFLTSVIYLGLTRYGLLFCHQAFQHQSLDAQQLSNRMTIPVFTGNATCKNIKKNSIYIYTHAGDWGEGAAPPPSRMTIPVFTHNPTCKNIYIYTHMQRSVLQAWLE